MRPKHKILFGAKKLGPRTTPGQTPGSFWTWSSDQVLMSSVTDYLSSGEIITEE